MQISVNQNEIILDDGTVLRAVPSRQHPCEFCYFYKTDAVAICSQIPCMPRSRNDGLNIIFIEKN